MPRPTEVASALFQIINQRYPRTSIMITTNRPAGAWGQIHPPTRTCVTSALGSEPPGQNGSRERGFGTITYEWLFREEIVASGYAD